MRYTSPIPAVCGETMRMRPWPEWMRTSVVRRPMTLPASQGEDLYLNVEQFVAGKGADTKAFHHRHRRIGLQESSPQNNFRRIIAIEAARGEIPRSARSALAPAAQPLPALIDRLLYAMAGLAEGEICGLQDRLARML